MADGRIHPAYLVIAESAATREDAFRAIEQAAIDPEWRDMCVNTYDGEQSTANEIIETLRTVPFMGGRRLVFVRRFDRLSADEQALVADVCATGVQGSVLLLTAESIDRRRKGIQTLLQCVELIECNPPQGSALVEWAMSQADERGLTLRRDSAVALVGQVGERTDNLTHELDKLASFLGDGATVRIEDIVQVVTVASPEAAQNEIFHLCDAVAEGRIQAALAGIDRLVATGAHPIYIVTMLARHYRRLLAVKTHGGRSASIVNDELGLGSRPFAVEHLIRQAAALSQHQIEDALTHLLRADMSLKRSALERSTLESVTIRLARLVSA